MDEILKDFGWCKVLHKDGEYFLSYDAGGIAVQMKKIKINKVQAETAMIDQHVAEKMVIEILKSQQS